MVTPDYGELVTFASEADLPSACQHRAGSRDDADDPLRERYGLEKVIALVRKID